jgi:hypothetical protein
MRVREIPAGDRFTLHDLIDGERRETYYARLDGDGDGRFVPTILYGFRQWDRDGNLRIERIGDGYPQMTFGLTVVKSPG